MNEMDLLTEYTLERVRTNTRAYRQLIGNPREPSIRGEEQESAKQKLCFYLDLQLERLHDWAEGPVDLLAMVTRSLLELLFWTEYVLETRQNAERFLAEQRIDLAELMKKAVLAFEAESNEMFSETPEGFADLLALKGRRVDGSKRGALDAYTFKLCSKYIHPSAWLLAKLDKHLNSEMNRRLFWMMSLRYASNISALLVLGSSDNLVTNIDIP
jgi:hypothetical protein